MTPETSHIVWGISRAVREPTRDVQPAVITGDLDANRGMTAKLICKYPWQLSGDPAQSSRLWINSSRHRIVHFEAPT